MMNLKAACLILGLPIFLIPASAESIDLAGKWRLALDRQSRGLEEEWFSKGLPGKDQVKLPGSLQEQGFGDEVGPQTPWTGSVKYDIWDKPQFAPYRTEENFKMPFWLQPEKYYKGAAWYQRKVSIPSSWKNQRILLTLERPHWETTVWVDAQKAGSVNRLGAPHAYDLSELLTPGRHTLTILVDNREVVDVGIESHSISDHTQSNWNGIVGRMELTAQPAVWIEDVQVYPDMKGAAARAVIRLGNRTGKPAPGELAMEVSFGKKTVAAEKLKLDIDPAGGEQEVELSLLGHINTWDEFNPNLYTLKTELKTKAGREENVTSFALREVDTKGTRIVLNDRPVFMRGTLECCIFPKTGYPPTDVESWKRIINICKAHGLNHIRFHSWCPPQAAFTAADELGFYYQVECSSWANYGGNDGIGNGKSVDQWLYDEADAILKAYGNHPSFLLMAYGNEPAGPGRGAEYLKKWVPHYQQKDSRRIYTSGSGWPMIEQSDFHVTPDPRIQAWGQELRSRINSKDPETQTDYRDYVARYPIGPVVSHEIGQWCVYPNFDEIKKYTGVLKAKNFELFRDLLKNKQMLDQAPDFLMASGKLQTLCYKEDIESALRTPGFGGFQLLDLHDFPGQGTALVGVLDPFWDSKPYVSPAEYSRFCNAVVPLLRLGKRIYTSSETIEADVEVSQFGPADLAGTVIQWALKDVKGKTVQQGSLSKPSMPAGDLYFVGGFRLPLAGLAAPAKYQLVLTIEGTEISNDWDIWVYPDAVAAEAPKEILVTDTLDENVTIHLQKGGKVLLAIKPATVKTNVQLGFSSIFWNTAWTSGQAPQTLGILCDPKHPALAAFPTEAWSNWQWSEPIRHAAVMEMDALPAGLRPVVQVVPDWFEPKRLGLVFEANVSGGSLLVCSVDLGGDLAGRPVSRQLKHSLLAYMQSGKFRPKTKLKAAAIQALFRQPSALARLNAKVTTDSEEANHEGGRIFDGNPSTFWHTEWSEKTAAYPHEVRIELDRPVKVSGFACLPRQDGNRNGWIGDYEFFVSPDGENWSAPAAKGRFENNAGQKVVKLDAPAEGRFLRLIALSGFGQDSYASMAEFELLTE